MNELQPDKIKIHAKDINLKELFLVISRRFWIILLITTIMTGFGLYQSFTSQSVPLYETSARIVVEANPELRSTLQVIIKDSVILEEVVKKLNLNISAESLASKVNVQSVDNTQVISIGVSDTNPKRAAQLANTISNVFKEKIPSILGFSDVRILSDAKINDIPINQSQEHKIVIICLMIGLILGIGLVFLIESFDDSIYSEQTLATALGLPLLGKTSKMTKRNLKKKTKQPFDKTMQG